MKSEIAHPDAPVGKKLKYAAPERERRFLLRDVAAGEVVRTAALADNYLIGTRLRIRRSVESDGESTITIYKLTQKVPAPDGSPGLITTLYINQAEYERLAEVPALQLRKTRYSIAPFGIDVFEPPLDGLVIAEIEFASDEEMHAFPAPMFALAEITRDLRFTGGRLVQTSREELRRALAEFGIELAG